MPQLMIDTSAESAESLRLLAVLLTSYAGIKDTEAGIDRNQGLSIGQPVTAAHTTAIGDVPETTTATADASAIFGKNVVPQGTDTNVVQLFPGAPTLPAVTSAVTLPATGMPVVAPVAGNTTVTAPGSVSQVATVDAAGIPWDERIHQSNRNKKTDGTWMLKRGLDKTLAMSVLAELTAAKLATLPPAAPAAGPVSLPPPPVGLPLPPAPVASATLPRHPLAHNYRACLRGYPPFLSRPH
jgi:hypothetical protein